MGNKRANLSVPAGWSQQDRRFGESVKQNLDTLQGLRGDKLDRAVTFRDLLDTGLVTLAQGITNFDGNASSVAVVNEVANLEIPPAPTNLQADGAFQNIILTWDLKLYAGHSFVQVWRHTSDVIASATMVAQVSGFTGIYADAVGSGKTFYYWVRAINENNIPGPFNSSTGTQGQTAVDVTHLLGVLNGAITSSELANSLTTRIDLIDAADTVVNSVAYRVAQEASARAAAISAEATARANAISALILNEIPLYDSTAAYAVGQIVRISNTNSKLYICIQAVGASSSVAITDTNYWKLYGDYDSLKSSTDTSAAAITQINTISSSSTSAAALAINGLNSEVFASDGSSLLATASALNVVETEVFPQGTASASRLDTLDAEVFASDGSSLLATAAALSTVQTEVFPQGTSSASRLDTLDAEVFNSDGTSKLATASALSALNTEVFGSSGATSSRIDTLDTEVFNSDGTARLATASALSSLNTEVFGSGGGTSSRIDTLDTEVFNSDGSSKLATASAVSTLETEVFPNGTSNASRLDALDNVLFDSSGNAIVSATNLTTMKNQILDTNGNATATATQMQQLGSSYTNPLDGTANDVSLQVALETSASQVNGLRGQYTVKVDANGAVAGFGLATTSTSLGTGESEFYVNADRFAIMRGGSDTTAAVTPFVVQATATLIGGELVPAGVYMTDAFIKNGSIVAAKIADATIDNAKIANISAEKINAGKISTSRLNIDGTTLTSINVTDPNTGAVVPTLSVNQISANKINTGTLNANNVTISNLDATDINGDINVFDAVNSSMYVNLSSANVYYQILDQTLAAPDISHQVMASVVMQATKSQSGGTQVDMKITMTPTGGSTVTVFEGGHDHNFSNGSISQAAAGSLSSSTTTSVRVQVYAKKHGKGVVVTKIQGFIGGIR